MSYVEDFFYFGLLQNIAFLTKYWPAPLQVQSVWRLEGPLHSLCMSVPVLLYKNHSLIFIDPHCSSQTLTVTH